MQISDRRIAGILLLAAVLVGRADAAEKTPVPDTAAQRPVRKAAADLYAERFRSAKTDAQKAALAGEMIKAALDAPDGSTDQYVLLSIAAEVAAAAGDAPTALSAAEKLSARFQVKAEKLKADAFLSSARHATRSPQCRAVAEAATALVGELSRAEEFAAAIEVCEEAQSAAKEAREYVLARDFGARVDELKQQQAAAAQYREALAALERNASDPAANRAAGRYLCFVRGDWKRGVSMLALGSDEQLKALALKELTPPSTAKEQAALGDAWWELAQTREGSEKESLMVRAGTWYREASGGLDGLAQVKVERRLKEIAETGREIPESPVGPPLAVAPFDSERAEQLQSRWAKHLGMPARRDVELPGGVKLTMVLIPPGEFPMGSTDKEVERLLAEAGRQNMPDWYLRVVAGEAPRHPVRITRPFYLGTYEVTQAQWQAVMGDNPSKLVAPTNPVEQVSWDDVQAFLKKLNESDDVHKRPEDAGQSAVAEVFVLPTEAQWEYACRAGTTTLFPFGDDDATLGQYAWYRANSGFKTQPVGKRKANAWGVHDAIGNVWEWTADFHSIDYYRQSPPSDPPGPATGLGHAVRGGCLDGPAGYCRPAMRSHNPPGHRVGNLGFRLALVPAEK